MLYPDSDGDWGATWLVTSSPGLRRRRTAGSATRGTPE